MTLQSSNKHSVDLYILMSNTLSYKCLICYNKCLIYPSSLSTMHCNHKTILWLLSAVILYQYLNIEINALFQSWHRYEYMFLQLYHFNNEGNLLKIYCTIKHLCKGILDFKMHKLAKHLFEWNSETV